MLLIIGPCIGHKLQSQLLTSLSCCPPGLPPRRIWLELRKLHQAEQQQPGSWCRSMRLAYHLGLLHHIFPWLQDQHTSDAAKNAVIVAEKLQKVWNDRQQQQATRVIVPLSLLVAATLHPAGANRQQAFNQVGGQHTQWMAGYTQASH